MSRLTIEMVDNRPQRPRGQWTALRTGVWIVLMMAMAFWGTLIVLG